MPCFRQGVILKNSYFVWVILLFCYGERVKMFSGSITGKGDIMKPQAVQKDFNEMRSETRATTHQYSSVEFWVQDLNIFYHCKVRDTSQNGLCILIKEDSQVLDYLKIGQQIQLKLYQNGLNAGIESKSTEIRHITRQGEGRYSGHVLVGLRIE